MPSHRHHLRHPRPIRALLALFAILSSLVLAPRAVRADEALARQYFKRGIELYDKKQYAEALAAFEDAYKEKPSAGIKQNIALSLKGLNKSIEAATAFDEALDEGKGTLKPETQAAIEHELAELSKVLATMNISVVTEDRKPVEGAALSITPQNQPTRTLPPGALKRPIRLMPGFYTFSAHASGFPDPPEKKLGLVAGSPVDATFVVGARGQLSPGLPGEQSTITIKPSRPEATIRIDGVEVGHGTWTGTVANGPHRIEVGAPGWKTSTVDIVAGSPSSASEIPVTLIAAAEVPDEYMFPVTRSAKRRRFYVGVNGALEGMTYRLSPALGEAPGGDRRNIGGLALGGRLGFAFARVFAAELQADFGGGSEKYTLQNEPRDTDLGLFHWQVAPVLRFSSPGRVRFTSATGFGIQGISLTEKTPSPSDPATTLTRKGSGTAFSWLFDLGAQFDLGPVFFEAVFFVDVHGIGPVRDDAPPNDRFLLSSPGVRSGLRLGLGIFF